MRDDRAFCYRKRQVGNKSAQPSLHKLVNLTKMCNLLWNNSTNFLDMNLQILDKWIRGNFLFLCIILACLFAVFKKATIFQLEKPVSSTPPVEDNPLAKDQAFQQYWYVGLAEINTYELTQTLDTSQQTGQAQLIFSTEDFNTEKQVQVQSGSDSEATSVLKVNLIQKIAAGIYEYSLMNSTFTPTNYVVFPYSLKVTYSHQNLLGQEYSQLNWKGQKFLYEGKSYLAQEVQKDTSFKTAWLEDEIWNRIRLNPQTLPEGEIEMVPSLAYLRQTHQAVGAVACKATLEENKDSLSTKVSKRYSIEYPEKHRKVSIVFEAQFPFKILNWENTITENGKEITTVARLVQSKQVTIGRTQK